MIRSFLLACALAAGASSALAAEHVVSQKNKAFAMKSLSVKAGDKVVFRNEDAFVHNVFSLADADTFDLGSFGKDQARDHVFTKAGSFEVECAVHPEMKMVVTVAK
jgi:plastocyanin